MNMTPAVKLHAAFIITIVISVIPGTVMGVLSVLAFMGVVAASVRMKKHNPPESLSHSHAAFILHVIFVATLISVASLCAGSWYMLSHIDYAPFAPCHDTLAVQGEENPSFTAVYEAAKPCMNAFITDNRPLIIQAVILAAAPILLYAAVQALRGLSYALKGRSAPKSLRNVNDP
ncbi:MAG TPA: hypothetical protein PLO23_04280 [Alphaproteobacteria bacterium]|nr:hypothetical protein [Alphaproteobacteria bacterium]